MKREINPTEELLYPTPCVLVSCGREKPNIITIAWCGVACSNPPMLYVSIRPSRHSYKLIDAEGVFGINLPTEDMVKKVDACGLVSGKKVDKFGMCNFTVFYGKKTGVPLIEECPVNLELELKNRVELGVHTMFIGEVVGVYVDEGVRFHILDLKPICYIPFSGEYVKLGEIIGSYGFSKRGE